MEYHGDLVRRSLLKYWYEIGTKFNGSGTKVDELGTKYNPGVIKYRPLCQNTPLGGASPLGFIFDNFGILFRTKFIKFRTTIVELRTNFVFNMKDNNSRHKSCSSKKVQ